MRRHKIRLVRPLVQSLVRWLYKACASSYKSSYSCTSTAVQGLADARKRAHRSGLVQFFAVYQFDRGGILQMCHTVGELCNHAVRGSMVWRQTSDTIEFCILIPYLRSVLSVSPILDLDPFSIPKYT